MKKKICIVLCLGCIGTVSVVGCSNKNFDSKVTGDNQTTTENVSDILNDQEKKEGGYENESSSNADDKENSADDSEVLANADLRGAVLEFSDTGCNISIGTQTDDAEMVPAPGDDEELNKDLGEVLKTQDEEKRTELYDKILTRINDQAVTVPLYYPNRDYIYNNTRLTNVELAPTAYEGINWATLDVVE